MNRLNPDPTETVRRALCAVLNSNPQPLERIKQEYPDACETQELQEQYEVEGFMAPLVVVRRKADNQVGSMFFQDHPRVYFFFQPDQQSITTETHTP